MGTPFGNENETGVCRNRSIASTPARFSSHVGNISSGGRSKPGEPVGLSSTVYESAPLSVTQSGNTPSARYNKSPPVPATYVSPCVFAIASLIDAESAFTIFTRGGVLFELAHGSRISCE